MAVRTILTDPVPEKSTRYLSFTITDVDGVTPLVGADVLLTSLAVSLFDAASKGIINSRSVMSVLNTNGGSVSAAGVVILRLDAADTAILNPRTQSEQHVACFQWAWGVAPVKSSAYEIEFTVVNLLKVP